MTHLRRWLGYALLGLCFGVADWYAMEILKEIFPPLGIFGLIVGFAAMWGVWLLPALAVVAAELRASRRARWCAAAVALVWVCAIAAYYLLYGFLLAFDGEPPLSLGYALGHLAMRGWADWAEIMRTLLLRDIMRWGAAALACGALVGGALGAALGRLRARRPARAAA